jgi:hypothetical protein
MRMHKIDKELKKKLIIKRKIIKNKLDLLKQGELDQEKMLSPLTEHLENIIVSGGDEKKKDKEIPTCSIQQNIEEETQSSEQPQVVNSNFQKISGELEDEEPLQALPRKYINDMFKDVEDSFDHKYGVRYDKSSQSQKDYTQGRSKGGGQVGPAHPRILLAHPRVKVKHLLKTRYIGNNIKKSNTKALKTKTNCKK